MDLNVFEARQDDLDLERGNVAAEQQPEASAAHGWVTTVSGIFMIVAAVATTFFGPDHNVNKHFLRLSAATLDMVHWILNVAWGLAFALYAMYGPWSMLLPFQKSCHRLATIGVIGAVSLLDMHKGKIAPSFYPLSLTLLVEAMYASIDITCTIVKFVVGVSLVLVQAIRNLLVLLCSLWQRWFSLGVEFRVGA